MKKAVEGGFSVIEIIIVISVMAIITAIVLLGFSALNKNYLLEGTTQGVGVLLKDARARTLSGKGGFQYGVHIGSTSATLFRGSVFSSSDPTNEVMTFPSSVAIGTTTLSGTGYDVVFAKLRGTAGQYGTTSLYLTSDPSKYKNIIIQKSGLVEIQ